MYRYTIVAVHCWRTSPTCDVCENWGTRSLYGPYSPGEWFWNHHNGKNGNQTSCRGVIW